MNERIEELKLKAIDFADATYKYDLNEGFKIQEWDAIRLDEFAKLIIEECMRMCDVTEMGFETHGCSVEASGAITVKEYIAEHFGIEE